MNLRYDSPRTISLGCVAASGVVRLQSRRQIRRETGVIAVGATLALKNVDDRPLNAHEPQGATVKPLFVFVSGDHGRVRGWPGRKDVPLTDDARQDLPVTGPRERLDYLADE